jgi:hypothetical protein
MEMMSVTVPERFLAGDASASVDLSTRRASGQH